MQRDTKGLYCEKGVMNANSVSGKACMVLTVTEINSGFSKEWCCNCRLCVFLCVLSVDVCAGMDNVSSICKGLAVNPLLLEGESNENNYWKTKETVDVLGRSWSPIEPWSLAMLSLTGPWLHALETILKNLVNVKKKCKAGTFTRIRLCTNGTKVYIYKNGYWCWIQGEMTGL